MSRLPTENPARARDQRRRHGAKIATVTGSDTGVIGPTLTKLTGRATKSWPQPVRDWFDAWRRSPQARLFVSDVEWQHLGRAAYILESFYDADTPASVRVQCATYVKNIESLLGATHTDRVKTHMKIKPVESVEPAPPATVDYRSMLG